ncbi:MULTISPECIES: bacteriohemerythrin [Clostridium]|jgi:hemerythrin|uniref:bacteriohemerythrin n=1 Tax=Clostridium TaxID=1485 RepID=UPI000983F63B|nr:MULTISPECIES: hemerythrin family protein [Clostridium]AQR94747.1 bacteriohemerythrin [Clostridium saccharoperbutylacetonicum]NSB30588.1 hemerythrin [Clostridium saccharoperbutylacetonicum]
MSLRWDDKLLIGVENVDKQHKELFNYLDKFLSAVKEGKGKQEIENALNFLEDYTIKHFHDEEEIQKRYGYPRMNEQCKQHEAFKKELKDLRSGFEDIGASVLLALNVQNKMVNWVKNHISTLDRDLGEYIKNKK